MELDAVMFMSALTARAKQLQAEREVKQSYTNKFEYPVYWFHKYLYDGNIVETKMHLEARSL